VTHYDLIVIGAGPAGLFAAARAGAGGARVLVLEKMTEPGRKLLITGSGQCNLTHAGDIPGFFSHYGKQGSFLKPALRYFTNTDLVSYFTALGVPLRGREDEKIFPVSRKAQDILDALLEDCREHGVVIRCGEAVTGVERSGETFRVKTAAGEYHSTFILIATGGASYPSTGSSGDGYAFARALGHTIAGTAPALTPVRIREYPFSDLAGISLQDCTVSLFREGKKVDGFCGDLLLTHDGLSGPVILNASRYILPGDEVRVSFLPEEQRNDLVQALTGCGGTRVKTALMSFHLPERLLKRLLDLAGIPPEATCAHLTKASRNQVLQVVTGHQMTVEALGGYRIAMVTRGGVALGEVNGKTMESRIADGLFFAGEVLDIDGDTGGYNLQAAFSTAALGAAAILKRLERLRAE
jgi:predicted Rossmann fold flavoprotein